MLAVADAREVFAAADLLWRWVAKHGVVASMEEVVSIGVLGIASLPSPASEALGDGAFCLYSVNASARHSHPAPAAALDSSLLRTSVREFRHHQADSRWVSYDHKGITHHSRRLTVWSLRSNSGTDFLQLLFAFLHLLLFLLDHLV